MCSHAHSREEIDAPLLAEEEERQDPRAMTDHFFMYKYKTMWCPIGVQHEWHTCVYAHNYQDARRPGAIGYGAKLCPYWSKKDTGVDYCQRCPLGLRCPYSHGAKEQLYHPNYFKTVVCRDVKDKVCPRGSLCAFYHNKQERRKASTMAEPVDFNAPLPDKGYPDDWQSEFLSPPFLPESDRATTLGSGSGTAQTISTPSGSDDGMSMRQDDLLHHGEIINMQQPDTYCQQQQQPMVWLIPVNMANGVPMNGMQAGGPIPMSPMAMPMGMAPAPWVFMGNNAGIPDGGHCN